MRAKTQQSRWEVRSYSSKSQDISTLPPYTIEPRPRQSPLLSIIRTINVDFIIVGYLPIINSLAPNNVLEQISLDFALFKQYINDTTPQKTTNYTLVSQFKLHY